MKRLLLVIGIPAILGIVILAAWAVRARSPKAAAQESLHDTIHAAITNPARFAKSHFTGGIGAVLMAEPKTGVPVVHNVLTNSPAAEVGLRDGDRILQVDGVTTSGRTLLQNIESIRGFAVGSVTLTIQRAGSTNLQCVIRRSSWKSLGLPQ